MSNSQLKVYVPLSEFIWSGNSFADFPGLTISTIKPNFPDLATHLGSCEQKDLEKTRHWLSFHWSKGGQPTPSKVINLLLLSLWVIKPTKAHSRYYFCFGGNVSSSRVRVVRMLDQFNWIRGHVQYSFSELDLKAAAMTFCILRDMLLVKGRLFQALVLSMFGCMAQQWHVALICHSAAAEAILTYSTGPGVTKRLATAYACLVETSDIERNRAYEEFRRLYSVRSDIMHGRIHNRRQDDKLAILASFDTLLRRLWQAVVSSAEWRTALEGTDDDRKALFERVQGAYQAPAG